MLGYPVTPLPVGWTEHLGPNGQLYYYNAQTGASTYVRPVAPNVAAQAEQAKSKKEKPHIKTPIPGTDWLKVTTTEGNVFYSNKATKQSVWVVPEELKPALAALQAQQDQALQKSRPNKSELSSSAKGKRKVEETVPLDEITVSKKPKVEEVDDEEDESDEDEEEEDEEWQREAAEQLAAEAEAEKKRLEEAKRQEELEAEHLKAAAQRLVPDKVEISIEEGKALFKTLLREKDINPLHPWDMSLPKFVNDPRYVLLPSVAARREAFDDYCRERSRELRQQTVKKEKEAADPKEEFERLLKEEVESTRASWTDFRKTWKKDRRFYGWGRDEKERERRFRDYLKELGELKRMAAQKAELGFFAMLKEHAIGDGPSWKDVKKTLHSDPRYDAVGSSSLREELFNTYLKSRGASGVSTLEANDLKEDVSIVSREERRDKAVKEREGKVMAERHKVDLQIGKSRMGIDKEEGERIFRTLLTDAIREPQVTWESVLPQLQTDPRFNNSPLPLNQQLHLFHSHVSHLRARHQDNLRKLFESHCPSLAMSFKDLPLDSMMSSLPITKLGYGVNEVEQEFARWHREKTTAARTAFDEMLAENSFVEFWGRLGKLGTEKLSNDLKIEDDDLGEDEADKVDMKALAKTVDIKEMEKVLKNDKRYIVFDHNPAQREQWLRDYLSNLSAPKLSVHVSNR